MRIDPDAIAASRPDDREIQLLAAEVRRLQGVVASWADRFGDEESEMEGVLTLAEIIREVDGNHSLGASALAEAILSHRNIHQLCQPRLTGSEREALEWAATASDREHRVASDAADRGYHPEQARVWAENHASRAATLRGLLARLGGDA